MRMGSAAPLAPIPKGLAVLVCLWGVVVAGPTASAQAQVSGRAQASAQTAPAGEKPRPGPALGTASRSPIRIEADALEVRDREQKAVLTGGVKVVQDDTTMRCQLMTIFYEPKRDGKGAGGAVSDMAGPGGGRQIRRIEAEGQVVVVQKDQTATGDRGVYDMRTNTITLTGNVVITQGDGNVAKGSSLAIDLDSSTYRLVSAPEPAATGTAPSGGRIFMQFIPGSVKEPGGKDAKDKDRETAKPAARASTAQSGSVPAGRTP